MADLEPITRKEQFYDKIISAAESGGGGSTTLIEKSITANGEYNASDDSADGYSKVTVDVPNTYTAQDEGKVVDNGALVAQTTHAEITENGTYDITTNNSVSVNVGGGGVELSKNIACKPLTNALYSSGLWAAKTWNVDIDGRHIWTDGTDIYYSKSTSQYVLDTTTSTWNEKTWTGLTNFDGSYIWTDGENIYYSLGTSQYILDKSTSTWNVKTWNENVNGSYIWTDGENIYFSTAASQYVLDQSTSTWNTKTWEGFSFLDGSNIWTDGGNIYYSNGTAQYVLDKTTSTWNVKTWNNLTNFYGSYIWTDGENIYHSRNGTTHILINDTWVGKTWVGLSSSADLTGDFIWTDGENIYYSAWKNSSWYQYELKIYKGSNLNKLPSGKTHL